MRWSDRIRTAVASMRRQKLRFALTLSGIVLSTAMLVVSLTISLGVRAAIFEHLQKHEMLRRVEVFPGTELEDEKPPLNVPPAITEIVGEMSESRRERLREAQIQRWRTSAAVLPLTPLTPSIVEEIRQIPGVVTASPIGRETVRLSFGGRTIDANLVTVPANDPRIQTRLIAGRNFDQETTPEIILNEFALYRLGIIDETAIEPSLGRAVEVEFSNDPSTTPLRLLRWFQADISGLTPADLITLGKFRDLLPTAVDRLDLTEDERTRLRQILARKAPGQRTIAATTLQRSFPLTGVIKMQTRAERKKQPWFDNAISGAEAFIPQAIGETILQSIPRRAEEGYERVAVLVGSDRDLKPVVDRLKARGVQVFSLVDFVEQLRTNTTLIVFGMNFLAIIAIVVSALGIANTQVAAVLERTREIGIFKATGADDSHIQAIFLLEGAVLGLVGGVMGVLVGALLAWPGEMIAQSMIIETAPEMAGMRLFRFPVWVILGVPMLITLVATLASVIPARRAARIDPIRALRGITLTSTNWRMNLAEACLRKWTVAL